MHAYVFFVRRRNFLPQEIGCRLLWSCVCVGVAMALAVLRRLREKTCPMVEVHGDSSGGEEEGEAKPGARAQCGQFVWPCPRKYPADARQRMAQGSPIPSDLSKGRVGELFMKVAKDIGQSQNLSKLHVFDEPHKRYNKVTGKRERHKHVIFKMMMGFGHVRFQKQLARIGIYGHFSFNLVGYVAYLRYCLCESAKKLPSDLDQELWSWPPVAASALKALCSIDSPRMEARNGGARGRKRKLLTFSEVTDALVAGNVKSEKDLEIVECNLCSPSSFPLRRPPYPLPQIPNDCPWRTRGSWPRAGRPRATTSSTTHWAILAA